MMKREDNRKSEKSATTMLTTGEVALIFDVHASTIRQWNEQGIIKSYRIGPRSERRFRREDVAVAYLDRSIRKYLKDKSTIA